MLYLEFLVLENKSSERAIFSNWWVCVYINVAVKMPGSQETSYQVSLSDQVYIYITVYAKMLYICQRNIFIPKTLYTKAIYENVYYFH